MKKLLIISILYMASCKSESISSQDKVQDFACLNAVADKNFTLAEIDKFLVGTWTLKQVVSMLPNTKVPDVKIKFTGNDNVEIFETNVSKYKLKYKLAAGESNNFKFVQISTKPVTEAQNYLEGMINGTVRACETELLFDQGMAFDAPAYVFRKD